MVEGLLHELVDKSASSFVENQEGFKPPARKELTCREYTVDFEDKICLR